MRLSNVIIGSTLLFLSACNPFELTPLDVKTVKNDHIKVRWFKTSDISTMHECVEMKINFAWVKLLKTCGDGSIYNVLINKDTVIVEILKDSEIHEITPKYKGIFLRVDSSITLYQYMQKFSPENAENYK